MVFLIGLAWNIRRLQVSPVDVVEKEAMCHVRYYFRDSRVLKSRREGARTTSSKEGGSVNADMDWERITNCAVTGVITVIITRVTALRTKYGRGKWILLQTMDIRSAFRQVGVDLDRASE